MADGPHSRLGLILGAVVLVALALFMWTGGDLGGVKKVDGDRDLPRVTSPPPSADTGNTGAR